MQEQFKFFLMFPSMCCTFCFMVVALFQMGAVLMSSMAQNFKLQNLKTAEFQLVREWQESAFVKDVFVVDASQSCASKYADAQPLFTYDYPGLRTYYTNDGEKTFAAAHKSGKKTVENDMESPGFPLLQVSAFGGKRVCARMLDVKYTEVSHVNSMGDCPMGFTKCNGNGSISKKNQICVPKQKISGTNECPITSIEFVSGSKLAKRGFTYVMFNSHSKIGYSRSTDQLPLTQFQVQPSTPCYNSQTGPWAFEEFSYSHYYNELNSPQEIADVDLMVNPDDKWQNNCQVTSKGEYQSKRYSNILHDDPKFNSISIESENDIHDVMLEYAADYPDDAIEEHKKSAYLKFWAAPLLKYDSTCTFSGDSSADDALQQISTTANEFSLSSNLYALQGVFILRIFIIFFSVLYAFRMVLPGKYKILACLHPAIFYVVTFVIQSKISGLDTAQKQLQSQMTKFEEYSSKCIQPLDVYIYPLDLSFDSTIFDKFWTYEYWVVTLVTSQFLVCAACNPFNPFKKSQKEVEQVNIQDDQYAIN